MNTNEAKRMHTLALAFLDGSARYEDAVELAKLARVGAKELQETFDVKAAIEALAINAAQINAFADRAKKAEDQLAGSGPIPMRLHCPVCHALHVDEGPLAIIAHRTHACQSCGNLWAPAVVPTVGVRFLPGCKDGAP